MSLPDWLRMYREEAETPECMMPERLRRIEERVEAATPGPWRISLGSGTNICTWVQYENPTTGKTTVIADCCPDNALELAELDHRPNMKFIAHAREDVPMLLTLVRQLGKALEAEQRRRIRDLEGVSSPDLDEDAAAKWDAAMKVVWDEPWFSRSTNVPMPVDDATFYCQIDECSDGWECAMCGQTRSLIEGAPSENNMRYCSGCGRRVVGEVPWELDESEEDEA